MLNVGVKDWNRRLFDELIPLPDGTTYNSYLIQGSEKMALIDTVDPLQTGKLLSNLKSAGVQNIDYIIAPHGEQDHSGSIPALLALYPLAKVVTNQKCKDLLKDLLLVPDEKFITIADQEKLSLGDKTLQFIFTPWVHWPETLCVYLAEDKTLFSCDFFGSHLAQSDPYANDKCRVYEAAKRYYAEIMMPFRGVIRNNLEKLAKYEIKMIAPSHGPIYPEASFILDAYRDWSSDKVKNEVVVPFVSMHGSTLAMVDHFIGALMKKGITVKPFNLPVTDLGELAMALVDCATVVIGSPTVMAGPHPQAVYAAYLANALRPKARFASIIGSYGWGGKTVEQLAGMLGNLKVEILPPVLAKGYPKEDDFKRLETLAEEIGKRHQQL